MLGILAGKYECRASPRSCKVDPVTLASRIEKGYTAASASLTANPSRIAALDAAIDRIVWQVVGLGPDGILPEVRGPCR
jgi:hypothetical protein